MNKIEVLQYIFDARIIRYWELADHFGLSQGWAAWRLNQLKRLGYIENDRRNEWTITDRGITYLRYKGVDI